jgi:dolichol-phosphate mannosyltransferase
MGYTFQIGLLHKAVRRGFKVAEIPIHFVDRTYGKSKLGNEYIKNTLFYIFKVRFDELIHSRVLKFGVVGALGTLVQLLCLQLFRQWFPYTISNLLAIECAIVSNFILNNLWTFADRSVSSKALPSKFVQFNIASLGSVAIQALTSLFCEHIVGIRTLFMVGSVAIDTGVVFALIGIGLGLIWNYTAYSKVVWKK